MVGKRALSFISKGAEEHVEYSHLLPSSPGMAEKRKTQIYWLGKRRVARQFVIIMTLFVGEL